MGPTTRDAKRNVVTRRRVSAFVVGTMFLAAVWFGLRQYAVECRFAEVSARVERLGGKVTTWRDYSPWQLAAIKWMPPIRNYIGKQNTKVDLSYSAVTPNDLKEVATLSGLETVILNQATGVDDDALAALDGCATLERLWLSGAGVTDTSLRQLAGFANLRYLNLFDTSATDASEAFLRGLPRIERLGLRSSRFTAVMATDVTAASSSDGPLRAGVSCTVQGRFLTRAAPVAGAWTVEFHLINSDPQPRIVGFGEATVPASSPGWNKFQIASRFAGAAAGPHVIEILVEDAGPPCVHYRAARIGVVVVEAEPD
ncbi:MAG: hypothetical protein U0746_18245 [Gemmataceae bacterium]